MEKEEKTKAFEYLDHTADIQFHAWGSNIKEAFEQVALAMYNYMSEIEHVTIDPKSTFEIEVDGHDLESLLYNYLNEFLYQFSTEFIICKEISVIEFDEENFKIKAEGKGELFNKKKHPQGTEIKAITYSNMQINKSPTRVDVYVIVDI